VNPGEKGIIGGASCDVFSEAGRMLAQHQG
jgi:hypothetical protein